MGNVNIKDPFERVYYKVINYDTNEVIFERGYTTEIIRKLGIGHNALKTNRKKKPYYACKKSGINYKFIKLDT